ncbi:hypothetical protein [Streptomyces sp. NPDC018031]|uniref:hypothetical protein n=1 Tax=Streptomyces sp. NPDC018031 TaxID=3365033 RepID=UPI0037A25671
MNTSVMFINDGLFGITDAASIPADTARWSAGLAAPMDWGAWVSTGIHTGYVRIRAEVLSAAPSVEEADWEEIVEISVRSLEGDLRITSDGEITPDTLPTLNAQGPGWYRVRVHARGRSINPDGVAEEPTEEYLITCWPQGPADHLVIRTSPMIEASQQAHADDPPPQPAAHPAPTPMSAERASLLRHLKRRR